MNDPLKAIILLIVVWVGLSLLFTFVIPKAPTENPAELGCFPNYIGSCD